MGPVPHAERKRTPGGGARKISFYAIGLYATFDQHRSCWAHAIKGREFDVQLLGGSVAKFRGGRRRWRRLWRQSRRHREHAANSQLRVCSQHIHVFDFL